MKVLGIDPGSRITGFGVIDCHNSELKHIAHGAICLPEKAPLGVRLLQLSRELNQIFELYQPQITVIERVFLGKNPDSAFKLGHARGVCLMRAQEHGCEIFEYATREVKKGVTGQGNATKEHVQVILGAALKIRMQVSLDASDALALAYFHGSRMDVFRRLRGMEL